MYSASNICYFFTILFVALMAGLFFTWSISVIPGLAKLNDKNYLEAMQSLNRAILNPAFYLVFVGSILFLLINIWLQYKSGIDDKFYLLLIALVVYLLGAVAVTFFGNVPLNNQLESLDVANIGADQAASFRSNFEARWNMLNMVRTFSSISSLAILLVSLMMKSNS